MMYEENDVCGRCVSLIGGPQADDSYPGVVVPFTLLYFSNRWLMHHA